MSRAAVLSIGTELTRGELVNGNACFLSEALTALGFEVVEQATVDDDHGRIGAVLRRLAPDVAVVVATGGLGPTSDDLTTEAVAAVLGAKLVEDAASLEHIRKRFLRFGRPMSPSNAKQAVFPEGAVILRNPHGTAPGFGVTFGSARFFFMPGVPSEMEHMWNDEVVPRIGDLASRTSHQVHLRCFGMTESQIGDVLADLEVDGITLGYRASFPEIEVKVLARAATAAAAEEQARHIAEKVRERLGDTVFGERGDSFPAAVGRALRSRQLTLAVAESCTGGLVGAMLTSVPGSSDYLLLDAVAYANSAKTKLLGISPDLLRAHGAVSLESVAAMAEGALRISGADLAVAVTGIAGPGGGSDEKPVGTVYFALARKDDPTYTKQRFVPGDRDRVRTLSAYVALKLVLRAADGRSLEL